VDYHQIFLSLRKDTLQRMKDSYQPKISVIVRCGSRPIEYLERAVGSIARQTFGRFEVILVRYKNLDVSSLSTSNFPEIDEIRVIDCPDGNRSASLWAGLNTIQGECFAILDDDDWWFSDHFERLFHNVPKDRLAHLFAYSGTIMVCSTDQLIVGGGHDKRRLSTFGIRDARQYDNITEAFSSNCFVASRDLLYPELLINPNMDTAEESYLILSLIAESDPRFSFSATSVFDRHTKEHKAILKDSRRKEDELTLQLRTFGGIRPGILAIGNWSSLADLANERQENAAPGDSNYDMPAVLRQITLTCLSLLRDPAKRNKAIDLVSYYLRKGA
jgi:glycosyltransferase involved in cell wall biosynthesis